MEYTQPQAVSVIDPIGAAFEKTKEILFKPFSFEKWFVIGFTAWLAALGDGGRFNVGGGGGGDSSQSSGPASPNQAFNEVKEFFFEHLPVIISIAVAAILIFLILGLLFTWLKCRGKFMFLHCVAWNVAQVKNPWKQYVHQGNSLLLFKIVVWLIGLFSSLIFVVPLVLLIINLVRSDFETFTSQHLIAFICLGVGLSLLGLIFGIITTLTNHFVVPVMYKYQCTTLPGWKYFGALLKANKGKFTLYLLFQIVISIVIGTMVLLTVLLTCCCAACIFMIPYIGTVAMLPVLVWRRAYSALYLAQYGESYDVFPPRPQPVECVPPNQPPADDPSESHWRGI